MALPSPAERLADHEIDAPALATLHCDAICRCRWRREESRSVAYDRECAGRYLWVRSESVAAIARILIPAAPRDRRRGALIIGDVHDHRVWEGLRHEAVIMAQEAAEALSTHDRSSGIGVLVSRRRRRGDQPVV